MYRTVWTFDGSPWVYFQRWTRGEDKSGEHLGVYHKRPTSTRRLMRVLGNLDRENRVRSRFMSCEKMCWDVLVSPAPEVPVNAQ